MFKVSPFRPFGSSFTFVALVVACQARPAPPEPEPPVPTPSPSAVTSAASPPVVSSAATTAGNLAPVAASAEPSAAASAPAVASMSSAPSTTVPKVIPPGEDPEAGEFTLDEALKGLPTAGKLIAELQTDEGKLKCELYEDKAPVTVANFVGLARGLRPFKDPKTREWVKRPAYDDGVFHRIVKGFMIQGGDPTGTGRADGGYVFADEIWSGAAHDRRGLICMANKGKNTNSMQFFITDGPAPHLDGGYTIFGSCGPDSVIEKLASAEVQGDRAVTPPKIKKVTIKRAK